MLRRFVSSFLMLLGLAVVGLGVFYWWKGWPYATLVLRILSGYGSLAVGAGALLWPAAASTSILAAVSFTVSSALLFGLWVTAPWAATIYLTSAILSAVGALAGVGLFLLRRKVTVGTEGPGRHTARTDRSSSPGRPGARS